MTIHGSRLSMQESERRRMENALKFSGALVDEYAVRERVQSEKLECPICLKSVHPDNWNKHMTLEHQDSPVALHDSMPGRLSLAVIRMDGGTQPRAQIDLAVVADYVEQMTSGVVFPAVTVFYDGASYWLADGFHRVTAAKQTEETEILADVKQGTQRDAKLFSFSANATHGLRRTNSDKRRAVEAMLNDSEWAQWSNSEIARRCSVHHSFVGRLRKEVSLALNTSERTYTTKHGTIATMKTDNIGSKPTLPPNAPAVLQEAVDNGVVGVREAVKANEALNSLPESHHDTIARLTYGDMDKISILKRLHKSMGSPETNGTFDEVMRTGGFHYGDELEKWCDFEADNVESISKALQSVARNHAVIEAGNKQAEEEARRKQALKAFNSSESNEWYTPQEYVDTARALMGGIDLDPASSEIANQKVKAKQIYTIDDNGLDQVWTGRVFLNPPYGYSPDNNESNQAVWSKRLIELYTAGSVKEAVLLVNAVTDRAWFQPLWDYPICFTHHRVRFYRPNGEAGASPTMGSVLVYFGTQKKRFAEMFKQFGAVVLETVRE